jgi:uncharacterized protein
LAVTNPSHASAGWHLGAGSGWDPSIRWGDAFALLFPILITACTQPQAASQASAVRVDDQASLLSPAAEQRIAVALKNLERQTTDQVAVKTVSSLGGKAIDDVSLGTARRLALGRKGADNGVLLLVAPTERKIRIETGCGTAGVLSDAEAGTIVAQMTTSFRSGAMEQGIEEGVRAIDRELREHPSGSLRQIRDKRCS